MSEALVVGLRTVRMENWPTTISPINGATLLRVRSAKLALLGIAAMTTIPEEPDRFVLRGVVRHVELDKQERVRCFTVSADHARYLFKVQKLLRDPLQGHLRCGSKVEVSGTVILNPAKHKFTQAIEAISVFEGEAGTITTICMPAREASSRHQARTILVCKGSACWKKGGAELYEGLGQLIECEGLQSSCRVRTTGCLGHCKSAPNVRIMSEKISRRSVPLTELTTLILKDGRSMG